jgi:osmotically-inducible protein OsmY
MNKRSVMTRSLMIGAVAWSLLLALPGCVPLVIGGAAAGGAMVASDRRSVSQQLEDEGIERRINRALAERFPREVANISVNAYARRVLLTGEVATEADKAEAQAIAQRADKVDDVLNDLYVGPRSSLANRNFDLALTAKVRTRLLDAKGVPAGTIRVVSERSVVYLTGRVSAGEGDEAAKVASRVDGVRSVVKYFDYLK